MEKSYYGLAWVVLNGLVAVGSLISAKLERMFSFKGIMFFMAVPLSVLFIIVALKLSYIAFIPLVFFYLIRGTAHPILKDYINRLTTSEKRATVLSARSLLIRILYSIFGPLLGYLSDHYSLKMALTLCGFTVFVTSMVFIAIIFGQQKRETNLKY